MLRPPRREPSSRRVPFGRSVAAAVLVGYAVALGGTSSGHGLRLAAHLLAEHHEAHDRHDEAHHGDEAHDDHDGAEESAHSHHGRIHSHREAPPAPVLLSVELDKHCVFVGPVAVAPGEARRIDWPIRAATLAPVVLAVEVRPPQRAA